MADLAVAAAGLLLTAVLGWFFFGPKKSRSAELVGDVQEVRITVKGRQLYKNHIYLRLDRVFVFMIETGSFLASGYG